MDTISESIAVRFASRIQDLRAMMSIKDFLEKVLTEYPYARTEVFAGHPLAQFIRTGAKKAVELALGDQHHYIVTGSAGQGNWARGPWLAIFDPLVTSSAQSGYYVVYLFREDMEGVYLSLNQGMTEARRNYKSGAKAALNAKAANFRALLGDDTGALSLSEIDLAPASSSNITSFYESANIYAKFYSADALPSDVELLADIEEALSLYGRLLEAETANVATVENDVDAPDGLLYEDARKFRLHKRIERNPMLIKKVKEVKGLVCEVCKIDFSEVYGEVGAGYIEAHHLRPLASLRGQRVAMDPNIDFAVLCANCHRMVHRSQCIDDIEKFTAEHYIDSRRHSEKIN